MISMRRLLCFLTAMMLVTFAAPGIAAGGKTFYAQFPAFTTTTVTQVTGTFYNVSPNPSTINSIKIVVPMGPGGPLMKITNVSPGNASISADGTSAIVNGIPGIKKGANQPFMISVSNIAPGCNSGSWAAFANAGNSYPGGDEFAPDTGNMKLNTLVGCEITGTANCGGAAVPVSSVTDTAAPGYASLQLGASLKDGSSCGASQDFDALNTILFTDKLLINFPFQQNVAFAFALNSIPLAVDANGQASKRLRVAWELDANGNPLHGYIDAPACVDDQLPFAYGTLVSAMTPQASGTSANIQVTLTAAPSDVPSGPFLVVIGHELLKVTGVTPGSPYTFTVLRGQGGTNSNDPAIGNHAANAFVASTPEPIDTAADFYNGKQVHVCVSSYTWKFVGIDSSGNALVEYSATGFAIGNDPAFGWE